MTTLRISGQGKQITRLSLSGHAGYAQSGSDIVCAAISVLTSTCINALETVARVAPIVAQDERSAEITVELPHGLDKQQQHDAQVVLQTVVQGFSDISMEYPKYLKMIDGRKSSC